MLITTLPGVRSNANLESYLLYSKLRQSVDDDDFLMVILSFCHSLSVSFSDKD